MLTIHGRANSINVQKVLWAADECGLACDRRDVGGAFGGNDQDWYLAMNPNGVVPTIDDGGYVLWESNAIVRYLAASYGPPGLYPADPKDRGRSERWMDWQISTIQAGMTTLFWGLIRTPPEQRDLAAIEAARRATALLWERLDRHLASNPYLAGAGFSMGDIPAGCMAYRWLNLPFRRDDLPELAHLRAWYDRLATRTAYRKHVMIAMT
jgi:glutathione S-transferase